MKKKLLSLLLAVMLISISISIAVPSTTLAKTETNLFKNGNFSSFSGGTPTGWTVNGSAYTSAVDTVDKTPDGANSLKFTANSTTGTSTLWNNETISIKKNTKYTITFYVKDVNVPGLKFSLYEPEYVKYGVAGSNPGPSDMDNIYTYAWAYASPTGARTRVIRTDVAHTVSIAGSGQKLNGTIESMAKIRMGESNLLILTPDFPAQEQTGKWVQVVHTFTTGNSAEHEANVRYGITVPAVDAGVVSFGDFKCIAEKPPILYKPAVNDGNLGFTLPEEGTTLQDGETAELIAAPLDGNGFDGWYKGDTRVSTERTMSFAYNADDGMPTYEARFVAGPTAVSNAGNEDYTADQSLICVDPAKPSVKNPDWDVCSEYKLSWQKADVTTAHAHGGVNAVAMNSQYSYIGRNLTNLKKNTDYAVSFYMWMDASSSTAVRSLRSAVVLPKGDKIANNVKNEATGQSSAVFYPSTGYLGKLNSPVIGTGKWEKVAVAFNTKENTEVTLWMMYGDAGTLYVDDFAVFEPIRTDITAGIGGSVTSTGGYVAKNSTITVTATPMEDNRFIGWYDGDGKLVSKDSSYTCVVNAPIKLVAKFTSSLYAPDVNNANLGYVTFEGGTMSEGNTISFKAHPLDGNSFAGWYNDGVFVTQNADITFNYLKDTSLLRYEAKFTASATAVRNASNEDYLLNQSLISCASGELVFKDPDWEACSQFSLNWQKANITDQKAHSGLYSAALNCQYSFIGRNFYNLQKNTNYVTSFYMWLDESTSTNNRTLTDAIVLPKGQPVQTRVWNEATGVYDKVVAPKASYLGNMKSSTAGTGKWERVSLDFNSGDNTEVTLWLSYADAGTLYLDDFAVFQAVHINVAAGMGGTVTSNVGEIVPKSTSVTVSATPLQGNTFVGWFDADNRQVSTSPTYNFSADTDLTLTANFSGYNMPSRDIFALRGEDGSFETGTISGWFADDANFAENVSWCSWRRSNVLAYEGDYSLRMSARYRTSVLPLTNLNSNSYYRFSCYVMLPDADPKSVIEGLGICGSNDTKSIASATVALAKTRGNIAGGSGWNRVDLYFQTGSETSYNFLLRYNTDSTIANYSEVYLDNVTLTEYNPQAEFLNADFEQGMNRWLGNCEVVSENGSKAAKLATTGDPVYQILKTEPNSGYVVKFKAKGAVEAAAMDLSYPDPDIKNQLSSVSGVTTSDSAWKTYEYSFYSGVHQAINLSFAASSGEAWVDSVTVEKLQEPAGIIMEKIDFESDRFAIEPQADYEIYTATSTSDSNVLSGSKSLHFKYDSAAADVAHAFDKAYLGLQVGFGCNYRVTFNYKIAEGKNGGTIELAPDYLKTYGTDVGFEQSANNSDWKKLDFIFSNSSYSNIKLFISSIIYQTESDFYIDDITVAIAPNMVIEKPTRVTYCEELYNAIENSNFESAVTAENWKNLPSTAKVVNGAALKGSNYLKVSAGTKYVLPVKVLPGEQYYFGASLRGNTSASGYIGIAADPSLSVWYCNKDGQPDSQLYLTDKDGQWHRSGFKFNASNSGYVYLVINCTAGQIDLDSIMLFDDQYGYRYDPNDYSVYTDYDYDSLTTNTCYLNGGIGDQPYAQGLPQGLEEIDAQTPGTGEALLVPGIAISTIIMAFAILLTMRKRKEGANADEN